MALIQAATLSIDELEQLFAVYIPDLERVRTTKCYWPMLHVVLTMPDVCAALESQDGQTTGARYQDWCNRNLPSPFLTGADRYKIRCGLLHQGSSLPHVGSQYASVSFGDPDNAPVGSHGQVTPHPTGLNVMLDVAMLCDEMVVGLRRWFAELQQPANAQRLSNVVAHNGSLVRVQPKVLTFASGFTAGFPVTSSTSTS